jgi:DNA mismatch endonuclease (patch repair protein)
MRANRHRDTGPELWLRRELHGRGFRFKVDSLVISGLRRRVDIVFTRVRLAVFVDGCYWHGCPQHGTRARANSEYWLAKIRENQIRDLDTDKRLTAAGWTVLRIWEHEDIPSAADRVETAYDILSSSPRSGSRRYNTPESSVDPRGVI